MFPCVFVLKSLFIIISLRRVIIICEVPSFKTVKTIKNPLLAKWLKLTEMSSISLSCVNPGARVQERSVGEEGGFVMAKSVLDGTWKPLEPTACPGEGGEFPSGGDLWWLCLIISRCLGAAVSLLSQPSSLSWS